MKRMLIILVSLLISTGFANAQQNRATSVQLPTFGYNTVNTTVSVPDGGQTYMGGIKRYSEGRVESGSPLLPFKNRSIGYDSSASSFHATAYIHNFDEMEQQLLGSDRTASGPAVANGNRFIPIRYVSTQAQEKPVEQIAQSGQVTVQRRARSSAKAAAPLILSGDKSSKTMLGNVKENVRKR